MSIRPPSEAGGTGVLDPDLTTIETIDSTQTGVLASQGAGWVLRTYAQVKTALGLGKADVGLGNVDNTSDTGKPVSTAQQAALDLKAPLASPALTGVPTAPTAAQGTNTLQVATTAFARAEIAALVNSAPGTLDTLGEIATALTADESTAAALATTVAARMVYVLHGSTAATARPSTSGPVYWVGSVTPTNALQNDIWQDTSTTPATEKVRGASAFTSVGGTSVAFTDKGAWATATAYVVGDMVTQSNARYLCSTAHTSGTFATDLAAAKWVLADSPTATTQAAGDNSTKVATTAFVTAGRTKASVFGDASDGDVTVSGTVTLTRDMQYNNLTVSGTLNTAGYRVMIRGALAGAGTVQPGAAGDGTAVGGANWAQFNGYYGSTANSGQGGIGTTAAGGAGQNPGFATMLGAVGGAGGAGSGGAGGAAGGNSGITANTSGVGLVDISKIQPLMLWLGHGINGTGTTAGYNGGTGGGAGGGDGTAGGGGGQGGGVVIIFAYDASGFTGTIGANGGNGGSPAAGNRGGGGGGGGGFAALIAGTLPTGAYTMTATGGTGGTKTGTGVNGSNGSTGNTLAVTI